MRYQALWALFVAVLGACAATGETVDHSFAFNARQDSPEAEILDYRYGTSKQPSASNPDELRKEGRSLQATTIFANMVRGESLYVKWRARTTGRVHEDTVDLRSRLPRDLAQQTVYFMIEGQQLHVYLISREPRAPGSPPIGPRMYRDRKMIEIYPQRARD